MSLRSRECFQIFQGPKELCHVSEDEMSLENHHSPGAGKLYNDHKILAAAETEDRIDLPLADSDESMAPTSDIQVGLRVPVSGMSKSLGCQGNNHN